MGKGGGKQRTPYEAPNDLTSRQKLSIVDLVSEGPIEGPVGDLKGVYLNNTPVIDSSGNSNVNGMTAQWVSGTLEQPALEGFSSSSSETPVGIEIKKSTPVTRTITSRNIDRLRLTFGTQTLVEVKDNGDRVPTAVELQIQVQRNGAWVTEKNLTIRGKRSNSPYLTAVIIDNLPSPPFSIRMVRITPDSNSDKLQNNTIWSSYTEITDINQTYPGSAVAGLTFESEQFGNQYPSRSYLIRGRIVQVPDNYNPETREYSGIWSGTFKPAYTNNPAWVLYDLLTNPRAGLGKRLKLSEIDKFALYVIGQYCDQRVPDGFGGTEPRVTCNAYITDIRKAYDFFQDLCSQMRVMFAWNGQMLTFIQDRPSDVVWPYTNANVVAGRFNYSFSPAKARHNIIEVRFIDPENGWKTSIEQITDDALVAQFGPNVLRLDAFGCTSRGQARRYGLWVLMTEKLETQTVEFDVGAEGLRHTPGDIIEIMDNDWVGGEDPISGRLIDINATQKVLTLDREITPPKSGSIFITLMNGTGKYERVKITGYLSNNQIKVEAVPKGLKAKTIWGINPPDLARRLFRAITISDKGDGTYSIIAVQHVPEKEAIVDQGVKFEPLPDTPLGGYIPPVENLSVEVSADSDNWQVEANWTTATAIRGVDFILKLTQAGRIVGTAKTQENRYRIGNLPQGNYLLSVVPQNNDGQKGEQASVSFDINPPPPPSYIDVEPGFFSLGIIPHVGGQNALRLQYEFWFSEKQIANINEVELLAEYLGNGTMWVIQGRKLKAGQTYYVYVRTINPVGKSQFVEANGKPEDRADEILEVIGDKFLSTEAGKRMESQIEDIALEQLEIKHELVDIDSKTIELDNKVLSLNTDLAIVNETTLQNQIYATNLRYEFKRETVRTEGKIFRLEEVNAQQDAAAARFQEQISARVDYNTSAILRVEHAQVTLEEATAEKINQVTAEVDAAKGRITTVEKTTATLEKAQAEFKQSTIAEFGDIYGAITRMEIANTNKEIAQAETAMQTIASFSKMTDRLRTSEASILRNEKAIATADKAIAETGVQLKAHIDDTAANITEIKKVQVEQDKALAQTREQLTADIKAGDDQLKEDINKQGRELSDVSSVVDSQKTAIANLEETATETKENQQSIYEEMHANFAQVRKTQADQALSQAESTSQTTAEVSKVRNDNRKIKAQVERTEEATATLEKAQAKLSEKVSALNEETEAAFVRVTESIAEVDKAQTQHTEQTRAELQKNIDEKGQQIDEQGKVIDKQGKDLSDVSSAVTKNTSAIADTNKTIAENEEKTSSRFEGNEADIAHMQKTETDKESSQAETLLQLAVQNMKQGNDARVIKASIIETNKLIATNEKALAEKFTQLNADYEQSNARVTQIEKVISDNEKAQAAANELIHSEIKDTKAEIEKRAETSVDHNGNASSVFSIKSAVMLNGQYYEAQMMIGAIVKNGKVTTQIGFSADTFGIFNPSSGKLEPAFMVVNGQVVINEAFINKAVIGSIVVQTDMRSPDYVPGKSGMRIDMQNGVFETNSNDGDYSVIRNSKGNYFKYKGVYIMEQGWFL
ncbi:TipJ family phage tail tip protein [Providencia hangzhouensis]|uniref:TipJ family phage tail tip protein n=2 Tax=Morganellaceae TaxID=1903414 RepID=UPI00234AB56C|nr:phage tail protein [Providencia sp. PROV099]WOB96921.1 phage tail protein [Providencia sp. PROV099]